MVASRIDDWRWKDAQDFLLGFQGTAGMGSGCPVLCCVRPQEIGVLPPLDGAHSAQSGGVGSVLSWAVGVLPPAAHFLTAGGFNHVTLFCVSSFVYL